jgi:hypothetical protein
MTNRSWPPPRAIDEVLPVLLNAMDSDSEDAGYALDGLREVMAVKSNVALPFLIPKLTHEPLTAQNAHALKALAEVSGEVCGPLRIRGLRGHERLQHAPWRRFFLIGSF